MDGQYQIDSVYAFTTVDADGTEGIVGAYMGAGWMPLVGADLAMVAKLKPIAQRIATATGREIKLVHFSTRTEQETLKP